MNICIVAGARPNFVKVAPITRAIECLADKGHNISYKLVYTGCADDPTLEAQLYDDLRMKAPDAYLDADFENLNELTGQVMAAFEHYLETNPADTVIVVDDLASTMAAAIVAKKRGIMLAHLVAGTRSFDINMPKEINRLVIDGLSDLLFTAGMGNYSVATREGAEQSKIYIVGNILMDTLRYNHTRMKRPEIMDLLGILEGQYILFTLNRKALIADEANLQRMIFAMIANAAGKTIIAPLRESAARVVKPILQRLGEMGKTMHVVKPMAYLEFGYMSAHALGVVTDSGNVAEEATFNAVPCITLNSYTEHIETVKVGTNVLVGEDDAEVGRNMALMVRGKWKKSAVPERWDGRTAERIVQIIIGKLQDNNII